MAWFWGIEASFIISILESIGLLLILPLGIRASWNITILLHGTGHTLLIAAVDGRAPRKISAFQSFCGHEKAANQAA